jgi:TolA-binding protein
MHEEKRRADDLAALGQRREAGQAEALRIYRLVRANKRREAVDAFARADLSAFSPAEVEFLRDAIGAFRAAMARKAFSEGLGHFNAKRLIAAEKAFEEALELKDDAEFIPDAIYHLALTHFQLGNFRACITELVRTKELALDEKLVDDARFYLAAAYEQIHEYARATEEYSALLKDFPKSPWAEEARRRLFLLKSK